jgi:uncharacterized membrane protein
MYRHPANIARYDSTSVVHNMVDRFVSAFGSVKFLGIQTVIIIVWIILNIFAFTFRWDPYPFILLNLVFSTQAAYAAPLILLSQNRQTEHDRMRAESDLATDIEALELLKRLHADHTQLAEEIRAAKPHTLRLPKVNSGD